MNSFFKQNIAYLSVIYFLISNSHAYNIVERAKLIDDRINSLEITRDIGHDFHLNIRGLYAPEILDLMDDAEKLKDLDTSNTAAALDKVNTTLSKYYNKEQVVKADVGLGFPLPSFRIFKTKIKPNFRIDGGIFAMLTPQKNVTSLTKIIDGLDQIPAELRTALKDCLTPPPADGTDLLVYCKDQGAITALQVQLIKDQYGLTSLPYSTTLAASDVDTPAIDIYAKIQAKAGFFNDYKDGKHFFGKFNLYALSRTDIKKYADALLLLGGGSKLEYAKNLLINLAFDYSFGYKNSNYSAFAAIEEVSIAELKKETESELNWGDDLVVRFHAEAKYRFAFFKVNPYIGSHLRSGYGFGDAYYLGADWGAFVFKDRLGLNVKTQFDKEHITLGLRAKIWIIHAEVTSKLPITSEVDGIKVSSYHGANFRIFF